MKRHFSLVADSGSTKTDWLLSENGKRIMLSSTQGINPFHQEYSDIKAVLERELLPQLAVGLHIQSSELSFDCVRFYGAGCRGEAVGKMERLLGQVLQCAAVGVYSDLMAAAHALCGKEEGIVGILGTGANSGLYDGERLLANVSPLGYILGDEGSGAVLGRLFLNALFKGGMPDTLREEFLLYSGLTLDGIINKVYRQPMANRFLASLSPFIHSHLDMPCVENLVVGNFNDFFQKNVSHYGRPDLAFNAVGSVAYYYEKQLRLSAEQCGYRVGKILKSPIDGLG